MEGLLYADSCDGGGGRWGDSGAGGYDHTEGGEAIVVMVWGMLGR